MTTLFRRGLAVPVASPDLPAVAVNALTDEAAFAAGPGVDFRVELLVAQGDRVAQGAPVLRSRRQPKIVLTAPMPAHVARIELGPGRRLSRLVFFRDEGGDRHRHQVAAGDDALRAALLGAGLWTALRSRPFGHFPAPDEIPAAIFVMALDTRPLAPDPRTALAGREEDFRRGLDALSRLTPGVVHLVAAPGHALAEPGPRLRVHTVRPLHPAGLAGGHVHRLHPARTDARVWDIAAEDVVAIGAFLATGLVEETRLVSVAGPGLREARLVRTQPGADLRALAHGLMTPGQRVILSGSALDGREAAFLALRDRQVTVLPRPAAPPAAHWFRRALSLASRPVPLIPTAALEQALGPGIPVLPLLRALSAGDGETAERLGALSLLEEDMALADYVTGASPPLAVLLRGLLSRIEEEGA